MGRIDRTCPLSDVSPIPSFDFSEAIADLDSRGIRPDAFEPDDAASRFQLLMSCRSSQFQFMTFSPTREDLLIQISRMPTWEIAQRLTALYQEAYAYDADTGLMDVADASTKRQLDLFVSILESRAREDEAFLDRIFQPFGRIEESRCEAEPTDPEEAPRRDIALVLSLNSDRLSPEDRGAFFRLWNGWVSFEAWSAQRLLADFDWLQAYDGQTPWFETSHWLSSFELQNVLYAWIGREELLRLEAESFPWAGMEETARLGGWEEDYRRLSGMTTSELAGRLNDLSQLMVLPETSAAARKRLLAEYVLISKVLMGRGEDYEGEIRETWIEDAMRSHGFSREDAEMFSEEGGSQYTVSRLDDYRARFRLLAKFREIYAGFLTASPEERFAPAKSGRYVLWGHYLLNQMVTGAPIRIEDIEKTRRDVRAELAPQWDPAVSWNAFLSRDPAKAYLFGARDFLRLDPFTAPDGPEAAANSILVGAKTVREYVGDQADVIAVLPPEMMPVEHAHGAAYMLFGVIILNGSLWDTRRFSPSSPGQLLEVLAHEAAHHEWAGSVFDQAPERLLWQAANERFAFRTGHQVLKDYLSQGYGNADERTRLKATEKHTAAFLSATNRRLGLPEGDGSMDPLDARWTGKPPSFFSFYPSALVDARGVERPFANDLVQGMDGKSRMELWDGLVSRTVSSLGLMKDEAVRLSTAFSALDALTDSGISETFPAHHPVTRFFGQMRGTEGLDHITFTGESWRFWKDQFMAQELGAAAHRQGITESLKIAAGFWERVGATLGDEDARKVKEALAELNRYPSNPPVFPGDHPLVKVINHYLAFAGWNPMAELRLAHPYEWVEIQLRLATVESEITL